jgi:hypothetical protein
MGRSKIYVIARALILSEVEGWPEAIFMIKVEIASVALLLRNDI